MQLLKVNRTKPSASTAPRYETEGLFLFPPTNWQTLLVNFTWRDAESVCAFTVGIRATSVSDER